MTIGGKRSTAICFVAAVAALGLGAFVFVWSGLYNAAASQPHLSIVHRMIEFALRRSVETHSALMTHPAFDDSNLMRLGAAHFDSGCAPCHSAPGGMSNPVVENMLPRPPKLTLAASRWTPEQLFWIVKNGLKFTGMPAWVAQDREDEIWAVVAFLEALPNISAAEYRKVAAANVEALVRTGGMIAKYGAGTESISQCDRCHGTRSEPPTSALVPKLAGQSQAYLEITLRCFATGTRQSGIMQPVAAALTDGDAAELAKYYAGLPPTTAADSSQKPPPDQLERGKMIALSGVPENGIPPCLACHGDKRAATFPTLFGQHAAYLRNQLQLWRRGLRNQTAQGAIMAAIATRLSEQQIFEVAAWFESVGPRIPSEEVRRGRRRR